MRKCANCKTGTKDLQPVKVRIVAWSTRHVPTEFWCIYCRENSRAWRKAKGFVTPKATRRPKEGEQLDRATLRGLVVGDRVKWVNQSGAAYGTVIEKFRGVVRIKWDDTAGDMLLNWRSSHDRQRARNLHYVCKLPPPDPELGANYGEVHDPKQSPKDSR